LISTGRTTFGEAENSVERATIWQLGTWSKNQKAKGGLGVINLSVQNDALLLKQLDKFYKHEKIQWVSLI
jgi:hypothetical protein